MSPYSFANVHTKWIDELRSHCNQKVPVLLIGTKTDLRTQKGITANEAEALCEEIGAMKYLECSALTQEGLEIIFDEAVKAALNSMAASKKKKNTCSIM